MSHLNSFLAEGWVRHRRFQPKAHSFRYPLFMCWLDLSELDQVVAVSRFWSLERFNLVSFFRKDYLGEMQQPLQQAVESVIKKQTGQSFSGKICLLTHPRFLGFCFNPVSFYFCYPEDSETPRFILADITNTPWDERHCYVLDTQNSQPGHNKWTFEFDKIFHVSPFMPMDLRYVWKFSLHEPNLTIHMLLKNHEEHCFDATLQLKAQEINRQSMRSIPLSYPFMTASVVILIYWQALLLWLKGIPFFAHPDK